ncbi:hypothetical protein [Candidatus Hikarchaeum yamanae]|uniref:hypothetical protein n=1 Tax=Candidatus Hikarchaeum yamanae TaxID=2675326 RepID=UPI0039EA611C|tara:strand:+ start:4486 stop:4932 length:447 start_codon:yes stop_codon:yes gene_type:complete
MANKTLAELGLSPFNKFLVAYWFSLGALVLDQVMTFWGSWIPAILGNSMTLPDGSQITLTLASEPIGVGIFGIGVSIVILYSAYLLYQKKRVGALYAISANWLGAMYWLAVIMPAQGVEMPAALALGYSIVFILVAAGPTLLFPDEYS